MCIPEGPLLKSKHQILLYHLDSEWNFTILYTIILPALCDGLIPIPSRQIQEILFNLQRFVKTEFYGGSTN